MAVHVIPVWKRNPYNCLEVSTVLNFGEYRELSPFVLSAPPAKNLENLWQFSKVYSDQVDVSGNPNSDWFWWRRDGFYDERAHRYPKGKGAIPLYSIYPSLGDNRCTEHLGYIEARKRIYATEYAKNVILTDSYARLAELYKEHGEITLKDYDAYDHLAMGMSLINVINNPNRKMGHAFVLAMILKGELQKCLNS